MGFRKYITLLLIFYLIFPLGGCKKKYPEGPRFSLRGALHRIIGEWSFEKVYVNNIDVTEHIVDSLGLGKLVIKPSDEFDNLPFPTINLYTKSSIPNNNNSSGLFLMWGLSENKDSLGISRIGQDSTMSLVSVVPTTVSLPESWKILRLKKKELWLKLINNNITYESRLIRDDD